MKMRIMTSVMSCAVLLICGRLIAENRQAKIERLVFEAEHGKKIMAEINAQSPKNRASIEVILDSAVAALNSPDELARVGAQAPMLLNRLPELQKSFKAERTGKKTIDASRAEAKMRELRTEIEALIKRYDSLVTKDRASKTITALPSVNAAERKEARKSKEEMMGVVSRTRALIKELREMGDEKSADAYEDEIARIDKYEAPKQHVAPTKKQIDPNGLVEKTYFDLWKKLDKQQQAAVQKMLQSWDQDRLQSFDFVLKTLSETSGEAWDKTLVVMVTFLNSNKVDDKITVMLVDAANKVAKEKAAVEKRQQELARIQVESASKTRQQVAEEEEEEPEWAESMELPKTMEDKKAQESRNGKRSGRPSVQDIFTRVRERSPSPTRVKSEEGHGGRPTEEEWTTD